MKQKLHWPIFISLAAVIFVLLIAGSCAVILQKQVGVNNKQRQLVFSDHEKAQHKAINNFIAQWNDLQKFIPVTPVLGATSWQVSAFQFIGNNKLFVAFEDGHIMSAAIFGYDANNNFNYITTFKEDFPFTSAKWQEIVKTYGSEQYAVATYVNSTVRNGELVNFENWTEISENVFLQQGEDIAISVSNQAVEKICSMYGLSIRVSKCGEFYTSDLLGVFDAPSSVYDANGNNLNFVCGGNRAPSTQDDRCLLLNNCQVVRDSCSNPVVN